MCNINGRRHLPRPLAPSPELKDDSHTEVARRAEDLQKTEFRRAELRDALNVGSGKYLGAQGLRPSEMVPGCFQWNRVSLCHPGGMPAIRAV
jgi:hypothetical protein